MSSTQPARGTRDLLPAEIRRREYVTGIVREVYERYGFEPIETPAIENLETLLGKYGEEGNRLIFKILKRGDHEASGAADLGLRYDLTVPLARVVAEHQATLPRLFKRYQIQPVWRADRPARGRYREFYQCDIDAIGSTSLMVEVEVIATVAEVMDRLGFRDFDVRLNDRRLLGEVLRTAGIPAPLESEALVALDKLEKIGVDGVSREFEARGLEPAAAARLLAVFDAATAPGADVVGSLAGFLGTRAPLEPLEVIRSLAEATPAAGRIRLDPSLARGLSYYTGAIMEIAVPDLAGSLGGGGRYDHLIGMFLGRDVPACGFALGLERILLVMAERGMFPTALESRSAADALVLLWDDDGRARALGLAAELRAVGLRVDVYPDVDKPGRQLKYAAGRGYPFVAIEGADERAEGRVTVKDLRTGQQVSVPRSETAAWMRQHLQRAEPDTA